MTWRKVLASVLAVGGGAIIVDGCSTTNVTNIEASADAAATADVSEMPAPIAEEDAAHAVDDGEASVDASDFTDASTDAGAEAQVSVGLCGNDASDPGEQCDDGNVLKCDGCESCEPRQWLVGPSVTVPGGDTWLPEDDLTFEAWAKTSGDSVYLSDGDSTVLRCVSGYVNFTIHTPPVGAFPERYFQYEADVGCGDSVWHHVAATRSVSVTEPGYVRFKVVVFWDGQPVAATPGGELARTPGFGPRTELLVGTGTSIIDEARVSRVVRYAGAFAPPRRHVPDADTSLLLHLDGDGKDSSGGGHDAASVSGLFANDTGYQAGMCL